MTASRVLPCNVDRFLKPDGRYRYVIYTPLGSLRVSKVAGFWVAGSCKRRTLRELASIWDASDAAKDRELLRREAH